MKTSSKFQVGDLVKFYQKSDDLDYKMGLILKIHVKSSEGIFDISLFIDNKIKIFMFGNRKESELCFCLLKKKFLKNSISYREHLLRYIQNYIK